MIIANDYACLVASPSSWTLMNQCATVDYFRDPPPTTYLTTYFDSYFYHFIMYNLWWLGAPLG